MVGNDIDGMSGYRCGILSLCVVCYGMALCYTQVTQLDVAEEAFSQSLEIYTAVFRCGHDRISTSETTSVETSVVT